MSKHNRLDTTEQSYSRGVNRIVHKVSIPRSDFPTNPSGGHSSGGSSFGSVRIPSVSNGASSGTNVSRSSRHDSYNYFSEEPLTVAPAHSVTARHSYEDTVWFKDTLNSNDYRNFETRVSSDGELHHSPRGMICNSSRFMVTKPQGPMGVLDSVKYLAYNSVPFQVVGDETLYEIEMSACQVFDENRPIPRDFIPRVQNIHNDYRLCCSASVLYY